MSDTYYEVIVGNVGTVYSGNDEFEAMNTYRTYLGLSKDGFSRAYGEPVTVLAGGEIKHEYNPRTERNDR